MTSPITLTDVLSQIHRVVRNRARAWVREAYEKGYCDGIEDMIRAIGWDGDPMELERKIKEGARRRVELERRSAQEQPKEATS